MSRMQQVSYWFTNQFYEVVLTYLFKMLGLTPIHLSAAKNKLDTLKWISNYLKNHRDDSQSYIDARALNGETPLYFAAQEGHLHVVTWLVEKVSGLSRMLQHSFNCKLYNTIIILTIR